MEIKIYDDIIEIDGIRYEILGKTKVDKTTWWLLEVKKDNNTIHLLAYELSDLLHYTELFNSNTKVLDKLIEYQKALGGPLRETFRKKIIVNLARKIKSIAKDKRLQIQLIESINRAIKISKSVKIFYENLELSDAFVKVKDNIYVNLVFDMLLIIYDDYPHIILIIIEENKIEAVYTNLRNIARLIKNIKDKNKEKIEEIIELHYHTVDNKEKIAKILKEVIENIDNIKNEWLRNKIKAWLIKNSF